MKRVSPVVAWALLLCGCTSTPGVITSGGGSPSGGGKPGAGSGGSGGSGGSSTTTSTPPQPNFGFTPPPPGADGGGGGGKNCGAKAFNLERAPAQILIVLDRSGSMNEVVMGTMGSKWVNVTTALNETLTATNGTVLWGLKTFPLPTGCIVADGVEVPIAAMNATPIATAMQPIVPNGSTPTALAVTKAVEYLKGLGTNTPKYIVLATDGLPNCRAGGQAMDPDGAIMAVTAAAAEGFHTFVVGIATAMTAADTTLSQMAMAGLEPRAADPKYYPVANRADLVGALGLITGQVTNCVFPLDQLPPAPTDVTVRIDGMTVPRDPAHMTGWDLGANNASVQVYGSFCDALKNSAGGAKVEIVYGCYIP
jgi:hypothetical protein